MCGNYRSRCSDKRYEEVPPDGVRSSNNGGIEVWWDQKVITSKKFEARKEQEKIDKYMDLAAEVAPMHKVNMEVVGADRCGLVRGGQ